MGLRRSLFAVAIGAAAVVVGGVAGCKPRQAAFAPPPPPEVSVAAPVVKTMPQTLDFTGFTRGTEQVDVRARVRGFIQSRSVTGGERVKAGDPLFVIDPRPFEAAVRQAQADVAQNEARLRLAQIKLERTQQSAANNAVSKTELDQAIADRDAQAGALDFSKAKLTSAQLDLEYTNVRAPIDGRVSVRVPDVGELVGDNTSQVLCTIVNDARIYVTFNVPEAIVLEMRRQYNYSRPGEDGRPPLPVYVGFANDGERFPFAGHYERSDPGFDPNTGTTVVEAVFENPNGEIVPGAFARIRSVTGEETVTLVPDASVSTDQSGRFVLTVNDKGIVERTGVETGNVVSGFRKILSPLPPNTHVVVNGLQRARPGVTVKATLVTLPEPKLELGVGGGATTQPTSQPATQPTSQPTARSAQISGTF